VVALVVRRVPTELKVVLASSIAMRICLMKRLQSISILLVVLVAGMEPDVLEISHLLEELEEQLLHMEVLKII
jgi:hypothetical protein